MLFIPHDRLFPVVPFPGHQFDQGIELKQEQQQDDHGGDQHQQDIPHLALDRRLGNLRLQRHVSGLAILRAEGIGDQLGVFGGSLNLEDVLRNPEGFDVLLAADLTLHEILYVRHLPEIDSLVPDPFTLTSHEIQRGLDRFLNSVDIIVLIGINGKNRNHQDPDGQHRHSLNFHLAGSELDSLLLPVVPKRPHPDEQAQDQSHRQNRRHQAQLPAQSLKTVVKDFLGKHAPEEADGFFLLADRRKDDVQLPLPERPAVILLNRRQGEPEFIGSKIRLRPVRIAPVPFPLVEKLSLPVDHEGLGARKLPAERVENILYPIEILKALAKADGRFQPGNGLGFALGDQFLLQLDGCRPVVQVAHDGHKGDRQDGHQDQKQEDLPDLFIVLSHRFAASA